MNHLRVYIYQPFSTTPRVNTGALNKASVKSISTSYPSGLYSTAQIWAPMSISENVPWVGGDRVVVRNGVRIVWEGALSNIVYVVEGANQGIRLECVGYMEWLLGASTIDRRWCDTRISPAVWRVVTGASAADNATNDRQDRIRITPRPESWANNGAYTIEYAMPTGETVGRVKAKRTFRENSPTQEWVFRLRDGADASNFWNLTADTTDGSQNDTDNPAGTPNNKVMLQFMNSSGGAQTPTSDGTYYGQIEDVEVYRYTSSEMSQPQINTICTDCQSEVSNLNSDTTHIDTPASALALVPFISEGRESWSSVLERAAQYGDAAFNEWVISLIDSEQASSPDGKPVISCKQRSALTGFDYAVRLDEIEGGLELSRDYDNIANWITVEWRDIDDNRTKSITPDDDSNLKDTTSITDYGQRDLVIRLGQSDTTTATNIGRKVLAARKNPQWHVSGPITVRGAIRGDNGQMIPASEINAYNKRIKIENFLTDMTPTGESGGLTFYVSMTDYDDTTETCRISTGVPDDLAVILAQQDFVF